MRGGRNTSWKSCITISSGTRQYVDNIAIRELYSLLRATIMDAKVVYLLKMLINGPTLSTIMERMMAAD
jgi:hypothetical protein